MYLVLKTATNVRPKKLELVVPILVVVVSILINFSSIVRSQEYDSYLNWISKLENPIYKIAPSKSIDQYMNKTEKLFTKIDLDETLDEK
jgi:hypothetical protein